MEQSNPVSTVQYKKKYMIAYTCTIIRNSVQEALTTIGRCVLRKYVHTSTPKPSCLLLSMASLEDIASEFLCLSSCSKKNNLSYHIIDMSERKHCSVIRTIYSE